MIVLGALALLGWLLIFLFIHKGVVGYSTRPEVSDQCGPDSISVVICARNEASNIQSCLRSIVDQRDLKCTVQVILVDDHSDDETLPLARDLMQAHPEVKFDSLSLKANTGKKAALKQGIERANGDVLYLTDADCVLHPHTLRQLNMQMDRLVAFGPVLYQSSGFWERLQAAENLNNQAVTQAFMQWKHPIMANGANMMFTAQMKEAYLKTLDSGTVSGDDVFFAQSLSSDSYAYVRAHEAAVITQPATSWAALVQQRLRWSAKSKHYDSIIARVFATMVWGVNMLFVLLFLWPTIAPQHILWVCFLFLIKVLMEFAFHRHWFQFFGHRHRFIDALALSLIYPFYVTGIGLLSILDVRYQWKGRRHKA